MQGTSSLLTQPQTVVAILPMYRMPPAATAASAAQQITAAAGAAGGRGSAAAAAAATERAAVAAAAKKAAAAAAVAAVAAGRAAAAAEHPLRAWAPLTGTVIISHARGCPPVSKPPAASNAPSASAVQKATTQALQAAAAAAVEQANRAMADAAAAAAAAEVASERARKLAAPRGGGANGCVSGHPGVSLVPPGPSLVRLPAAGAAAAAGVPAGVGQVVSSTANGVITKPVAGAVAALRQSEPAAAALLTKSGPTAVLLGGSDCDGAAVGVAALGTGVVAAAGQRGVMTPGSFVHQIQRRQQQEQLRLHLQAQLLERQNMQLQQLIQQAQQEQQQQQHQQERQQHVRLKDYAGLPPPQLTEEQLQKQQYIQEQLQQLVIQQQQQRAAAAAGGDGGEGGEGAGRMQQLANNQQQQRAAAAGEGGGGTLPVLPSSGTLAAAAAGVAGAAGGGVGMKRSREGGLEEGPLALVASGGAAEEWEGQVAKKSRSLRQKGDVVDTAAAGDDDGEEGAEETEEDSSHASTTELGQQTGRRMGRGGVEGFCDAEGGGDSSSESGAELLLQLRALPSKVRGGGDEDLE